MTEHELKACRSCGASLPPPKPGQQRFYCSTGCRRVAEYAIKRIDRRLEGLERSLSNIRLGSDDFCYGLALARKGEAIQTYEREIALQSARLRELLATVSR